MSKCYGLICVVSLLLLVCAGCSENGMSKSDQVLYQQVIDRIRAGKIKTDEENGIKQPGGSVRLPQSASLPSDLSTASSDGEIYIFRPSGGQLLVVFKTWRGKGYNLEGFLYVGHSLGTDDINKDAYGKQIITLGPIDLTLEKQLNPNWYRVSYKLD